MEIKIDGFSANSISCGSYNSGGSGSSNILEAMNTYVNGKNIKIDGQYLTNLINNLIKQQEILIEYLKFKGIYISKEFEDFANSYDLINKLNDGDINE